MGVDQHKRNAAGIGPLSFAVVTVTDSRTEAEDESGKLIQDRMQEAGHQFVSYRLVKNELEVIRQHVLELVDRKVCCIVTTGGTGLSPRDVTVEAVTPLLDKSLGGFGELFRYLSFLEIGAAALMSRATAGSVRGTMVFCLPGSTGAVRLALERLILPELAHVIRELHR